MHALTGDCLHIPEFVSCDCGTQIPSHETRCGRCDASKQGVCVTCYEAPPLHRQICRGCYELRLQRARARAHGHLALIADAREHAARAECWDDRLSRGNSVDELMTSHDHELQWVDYYQAVLDGTVHVEPPKDMRIADAVIG